MQSNLDLDKETNKREKRESRNGYRPVTLIKTYGQLKGYLVQFSPTPRKVVSGDIFKDVSIFFDALVELEDGTFTVVTSKDIRCDDI